MNPVFKHYPHKIGLGAQSPSRQLFWCIFSLYESPLVKLKLTLNLLFYITFELLIE
jgi:hypothetical protein